MNKPISGKISEACKVSGFTQEKLGALLNVSPQAVSKWENDESLPDLALVPALCAALHLSADELLDVPPQPAVKGKALVRADAVRITTPTGVTLTIEGEQAVRTVQTADVSLVLDLLTDDTAMRILSALKVGAAVTEEALTETSGLAADSVQGALFRLLRREFIQCTPDGYVLGANAYLAFAVLAAAWLASPAGQAEVSSITTSYST